MNGIDPSFIIAAAVVCAAIGAAITSSKNRGVAEGLVLGGLLGLIGVIIALCLGKRAPRIPPPPPGLVAVQCMRCRAVQNVPTSVPEFACWQCQLVAPTPGYQRDGTSYLPTRSDDEPFR